MHQGIDTAAKLTAENAEKLRENGIEFVARYLVPNEGKTASKALTAEEAKIIHDAGLSLMLIWETTADRAKGGSDAGTEDGNRARELAEELRVPTGTVIYFAVDFDAQESDLPAIEEYYSAAVIATGRYNAGIYGSERVIRFMQGLTPWLWQCVAWSNEFLTFATVIQYQWQGSPDAKALAAEVGVAVDLDTATTLAGMWRSTGVTDETEEGNDMTNKFPDWAIRTIKTFIQSFFGVLIPEVCVILNGGFPESVAAAWKILAPVIAAALSAAICAAWNIIKDALGGNPT